ncbi:MAG TPA: D-alanyl-D-alanine carboxypeptidase family protein [Patescibacteria group bacterium]|nr:D-alanyl-D-alanine carboxypeptidase family protein [Patescibacteria group bacterium]
MKAFLKWLRLNPRQLINWLLVALSLSLLPTALRPLSFVRAIDYVLPGANDYPVNVSGVSAPNLSAQSAIVVDVGSKTIMMAKNPDLELLPASTTKIMTGLIALEAYRLDEVLTASVSAEGQVLGLKLGEKMTVENLLYGMLVASGNDAAQVLADNYPGGAKAFVAAMNQKAKALGLKDTQFTNPTGLDEAGHHTSVHDLSLLSATAMTNPVFTKIVATPKISVTDITGEKEYELLTINDLLGQVEGLVGVKTGWTELAGECLVTYVKRGERAIITVVLGSNDRFGESKTLIDWAFANFNWEGVAGATQ